jgi:hypothetical protein
MDTCDKERIRKLQEAPEKRRVMQKSEFKFATSGADIETWESSSARGESSKWRNIDDIDYAWVKTKVTSDSERSRGRQTLPEKKESPEKRQSPKKEQSSEKGRSREKETSHILKQRPRARSEVVRRPKPLSYDSHPNGFPDSKFDFVYPPVDNTVSPPVVNEDAANGVVG